ncbi:MAG TPA: hypothetical protein VFC00_06900 [Micromonosporaceae bacterium]|nr:hypothetical protein [Micromonosporaceae bacterium]
MNHSLRDLVLSVGTHRSNRPLSPLEVADAISHYSNEFGWEDCLSRISLTESTARKFLTLRELDESVASLVDWNNRPGTISFSSAAELRRLKPAEQREVRDGLLRNRMTRDEVRQVVQLRVRSGRPLRDLVAEVLGMRPQVVTLHLLLGGITEPEVTRALGDLAQKQRDELLLRATSGIDAGATLTSGRLLPDRFSVVTAKAISHEASMRIEREVNQGVKELLNLGM